MTLKELSNTVEQETGVTLADLRDRLKDRRRADARAMFSYKAHGAGYSLPQIGRFLHKNHTAILYAERRYKARQQIEQADEDRQRLRG